MREFVEGAKGLTRNPLGIIGLFIVLVYGFACLVLGFGASQFAPGDRDKIVWFIVLFPVLILAVFYRLVTTHHKKLYAPSDFKDENHFFAEPQSDTRRSKRLDEEAKRVADEEATTKAEHPPITPRPAAAIKSSYADAERLAFLALEQEIGHPFRKYVQVTSHGRREEFDGVLVTKDEAHLIEVKYFSRPAFKREFLEALIHRASSFMWDQTVGENTSTQSHEKVILWIAIVVDFPKDALPQFKKRVEDAVRCELYQVNLRFYHIDDLRAKYG